MAKKTARRRTLGEYKCPKCGRVFGMPAHLGRHMNSVHGQSSARRTAAKAGPRAPRKVTRNGHVSRPGPVAPADNAILEQMQEYRGQLAMQRAELDGRIEALDRAIAMLGGGTGGTPAGKPRRAATPRAAKAPAGGLAFRKGSLKEYIDAVLRKTGKPMRVKDITAGVCKAGYKTKNKTLHKSVGIALTQMPNVTRISRGVFRIR